MTIAGRPSLGAWVSYGLGTANQTLPAFVVMQDNAGTVVNRDAAQTALKAAEAIRNNRLYL